MTLDQYTEELKRLQEEFDTKSNNLMDLVLAGKSDPIEIGEYIEFCSGFMTSMQNILSKLLKNEYEYNIGEEHLKLAKLTRGCLKTILDNRMQGDLKQFTKMIDKSCKFDLFLTTVMTSMEYCLRKGETNGN